MYRSEGISGGILSPLRGHGGWKGYRTSAYKPRYICGQAVQWKFPAGQNAAAWVGAVSQDDVDNGPADGFKNGGDADLGDLPFSHLQLIERKESPVTASCLSV